MIKRLELLCTGNTDRTDFRETAERFATAHGLVGHVKKNSDGSIKIVAESEEEQLNSFFHDLNEDTEPYFDHYTKDWFPATGEFSRFSLDHI